MSHTAFLPGRQQTGHLHWAHRQPWLLLLVLGFSLSAPALAQTAPPTRYRVDQFTSEEGLPGHQIYDIEQTPDGYLWVATNGGLTRFDGHQFAVFDTPATPLVQNQRVTSLHKGSGDTLFLGTYEQVLSYANGAFTRIATIDYFQSFLSDLAQDQRGQLWGTYGQDLLYNSDGQFQLYAPKISSGTTAYPPLSVDAAGTVWLILSDTSRATLPASASVAPSLPERWELGRIEEGRPVPVARSPYAHLVLYPSRGEILVARTHGVMVEFANPQGQVRGRFMLPEEARPMLIDRDGHLWAKEGTSLATYAPEAAEPLSRIDLGFRPTFIPPWFEDREGNLWVGTFTEGLFRIQRLPFQVYSAAQGIERTPVLTIMKGRAGSVLVRERDYDVHRIKDGRVTPLIDHVGGIFEDTSGALLYFRDIFHLFRLKEGKERYLGSVRELNGSLNHQIYADPQEAGVFWMHDFVAVYRLVDPFGAAPTLTPILDDLTDPRQLFKDREGRLWVATMDGLYRLDGQQHTRFTTEDGLPDNRIRAIHEDPEGVLWFGTYGGGLVRYKAGRFQTVNESLGLAENIVSTILEDEAGYLWMSGNHGIHRAYRPDLNALLNGEREHVITVLYGRESGLLNPEASGLPGFKADEGHLWFSTFGGAAVVDPAAALKLGREPPIVHVQNVQVGDESFDTWYPVQLAAQQRRFEITYVGLSLRNPDGVHYRYRLEGFDEDWVEAGTQRRTNYTNVPPGAYTFRVQARNATGSWSQQDAVLALTVAPYFYETAWFYLLCTLAVLAVGYGGYRVRVRQLKAREQALNKQVQERTQALAQEKETVAMQAEALRSLDEAKSRFFANISHEFRTPLTLILGPLEDLQDGLHGPMPADGARQVHTAISNGRRLLRLVNQLLDVSRLESGKIELQAQEGDMTAFVERLVLAFVPMAERKQIAFRFEGPGRALPVYFDAEQFEKVLANLLGNAFKFTPEQGTILVTLGTEEIGGSPGMMVLTVRDNGPGIAPEHLPHLFERFYQADASSTRRQAGTGIGLALVKNLVELHQGTVAVESHVGLGTTFTVRLPLGRAHLRDEEIVPTTSDADGLDVVSRLEADTAITFADEIQVERDEAPDVVLPEAPHGVDDDATTVLVVDDNPDVRAYVRRHLAGRYRMLEAADGKQALDLVHDHLPDLVVSDVMMPELDGVGLCRALKRDPETDFIPVILLTAKASVESKIEGLEGGADDYLTKPFNVRELAVRVENLIASRQRLKHRYAGSSDGSYALLSPPTQAPLTDDEAAFSEQVRAEIEARLSDDALDVDTLAAALGLGRTTLYHRLDDTFGKTPMDLIWQLRLERAAALLSHRQGTVSEIAYGVGFKSVAHFSNRFRDQFGLSPTAYKAQHLADPE